MSNYYSISRIPVLENKDQASQPGLLLWLGTSLRYLRLLRDNDRHDDIDDSDPAETRELASTVRKRTVVGVEGDKINLDRLDNEINRPILVNVRQLHQYNPDGLEYAR